MKKKAEAIKLYMTKADVALIIICLLAALILALCLFNGQKAGKILQISYDGEIIMTMDLTEVAGDLLKRDVESVERGVYYLITYETSHENSRAIPVLYEERPDIPEDVSYNLVYISSEEVQMEAADCRDQICVHHRPITGGKESIICLPHRLVVEIIGEEQDGRMDGMVK